MKMSAIDTIFTTAEQREIKQGFKEILIDKFKEESEEGYIYDQDEINSIVSEIINEVIDEIKDEMKDTLKKYILSTVINLDEKSLIKIVKDALKWI